MGHLDRLFAASQRALVQTLERFGEVKTRPHPRNPDCVSVTVEGAIEGVAFGVRRHYQGVALELFLDDELVASMDAGEEVPIVMYALIRKQLENSERSRDHLEMTVEYYRHVKETDPDAYARYKAIGKEKGGERPAE